MLAGEIAVHVFPAFRRRVTHGWLRSVAACALQEGRVSEPVELGVVVADDETVQRLSHDYRGENSVTDVLAFAFQPPRDLERHPPPPTPDIPFPTPPNGPLPLGEVVLSYPQAKRQARQLARSRASEVADWTAGRRPEGFGAAGPAGACDGHPEGLPVRGSAAWRVDPPASPRVPEPAWGLPAPPGSRVDGSAGPPTLDSTEAREHANSHAPGRAGRATGQRWTVRREVALLLAHGILHLLGYDHATVAEEVLMQERQARVVAAAFPGDGR